MKRFLTLDQCTMGYEINGVKYISKMSNPGIYSIWVESGNGTFFAGHITARNYKQSVIKADEQNFNILDWNTEARV